MRNAVWVGLAWFGTVVCTAFASELSVAHVLPEIVVIVAVFLAFEREGPALVASCLAMGYLVGRAAGAPLGLHELALASTALGLQLVIGSITTGGGRGFFTLSVGVATMAYHAIAFLLLLFFRGTASFPTWTSAILFPSAVLTAAIALLAHPLMEKIERRLSPQQRESLSFR
ncbi:MAG: hypothetical protein AAFY60_15835 [Myxococcota bacterium]